METNSFAETIISERYAHDIGGRKETWEEIAKRVAINVMGAVNAPYDMVREIEELIVAKKFVPGGRYLAAAGREIHNTQNCLALRAEDSREGWATLMFRSTMALMMGSGIGVVYSDLREEGAKIRRTGGISSGPLALLNMVNEGGRGIRAGGSRRGAIWGGLHWWHPDIHKFIRLKNWSPEITEMKNKDYNFPAPLDGTNISVILDDDFFAAYADKNHPKHHIAHGVYWATIQNMLKTGEPGFSVNVGVNSKEILANACTEFRTEDDSDICNLGSINMARITSLQEMRRVVELGTAFLLAGTVYSDIPYPKVADVRTKNRRLGLGLMGLHEWLLMHGKKYGEDAELGEYLKIYTDSGNYANFYADKWNLSHPLKTRAVAPGGTISLAAETTSGIEPIFCVAYKRRYMKGNTVIHQYIIDPGAKRLIENGMGPDQIEDAYLLAEDVERRVAFQAWIQKYVDMAIASTINLPAWGSEFNNQGTVAKFGEMLLKYLPTLRGITAYPEGARSSQPLTPVKYETAIKHVGEVFVEQMDVCERAKTSTCG